MRLTGVRAGSRHGNNDAVNLKVSFIEALLTGNVFVMAVGTLRNKLLFRTLRRHHEESPTNEV